jgi:hypothetical protein
MICVGQMKQENAPEGAFFIYGICTIQSPFSSLHRKLIFDQAAPVHLCVIKRKPGCINPEITLKGKHTTPQ